MPSPENTGSALPERFLPVPDERTLANADPVRDILEAAAPAFEAALARQNQLVERIERVFQAVLREELSNPTDTGAGKPRGLNMGTLKFDLELNDATRNARIKGLDKWRELLSAQVGRLGNFGEDRDSILAAVSRASDAMAEEQGRTEAYVQALEAGEDRKKAMIHLLPDGVKGMLR